MPEAIRVLLVDDHQVVRQGVRLVLSAQDDIEVVGEASDAFAAIELCKDLTPDVVVMDIGLPGLDGLEATQRIKLAVPSTSVLVLTVEEDDEYVVRAIKAGAVGFVPKRAAAVDLVSAVRSVFTCGGYMHPTATRPLMEDYRRATCRPEGNADGLTERETEILRMIASGMTTRAIADRLFLSNKTIQAHRSNIMAKLGVHNAAALVRLAIQRGLVR